MAEEADDQARPNFAGPNVLEVAQYIDVIWFKAGTAAPVEFFEIEHSTSIYSGLLRINDIRIDYPVSEVVIVAAERTGVLDSRSRSSGAHSTTVASLRRAAL